MDPTFKTHERRRGKHPTGGPYADRVSEALHYSLAGRQARAVRNDARILDAAVAVLARDGWGGLAFTRVAEECGLSERPIRDRFASRGELAGSIWLLRAWPTLASAVTALLAAATPRVDGLNRDLVLAALRPFTNPDAEMRAARELLLAARFDAQMEASVHRVSGQVLDPWLTPVSGHLTRTRAASHGYTVMLGLGLLLHADRPGSAELDLTANVENLCDALSNPGPLQQLPTRRWSHLDHPAVFDTGDEAWDAILQATLNQVGNHGFDATTMLGIARSAGYSEGAIFNRYSSKQDLFIDATERMLAHAATLNAVAQQRVATDHSPAVAEAVMLREMMRPEHNRLRTVTLEQIRLASHEPAVAAAIEQAVRAAVEELTGGFDTDAATQAAVHVGLAIGNGALLLADLHPPAWKLPFVVMTGAKQNTPN